MDPATDNVPENDHAIESEGLKFVFHAQRDVFPNNPCPYNDDGNPDMYTTEAMEKREELKKNPIVREAINDFIQQQFPGRNAQGHCQKEEYIKVFMNIGAILRPNIDADDLSKLVREDFESDSMDKFTPPPIDKSGEANEADEMKKAE